MIRSGLSKVRRTGRHERSPAGRRFALLVCVGALVAVPLVASQAQALLSLANPPAFTFVVDENGADDQPGQKDLSAQAVANPAPGDLWVSWKWDVTSMSGGNTGDACALFDTNLNSKVNFAVCVTIAGNPAAQPGVSPRVYTCGDGKFDRCTSTYTQVANINTACATNTNATDPFHAGQKDTQAICRVDLNDVGGFGTANLVNTCSYPSQQPTSDPSDCVLIPRDAFLRIAKVTDPAQTSQTFDFKLGETTDANPPVVFTATGTQTSNYIAIRSDKKYNLSEVVPANWSINGTPSCTGASGTGSSNGTFGGSTISNIDASADNQITCTFNNRQQLGSVQVLKTDDLGANLGGATFSLYKDNAPVGGGTPGAEDVGTLQAPIAAVGTCTTGADGKCTIASKPLGSYWLIETGVPTGYNGADPKAVTLTQGNVTVDVSFVNSRRSGSVKIVKVDDANSLMDGVRFTLTGTSTYGDTVNRDCTTALVPKGECTIAGVPLGTYTLDEDATTIVAGFTKDPSLPKQVSVTSDGQLVTVNVTNPRSLRVITLVCFEGNVALRATDVTSGATTKTSIAAVPAALVAKTVTMADLCSLGGASFEGLPRTDKTFSVDLG